MKPNAANGCRPDVLYLVHRVPYPPDKGDRIRAYHLLRYLSRHAAVHLATLADEPVPEQTLAALQALCARVAVVPLGHWSRWLRAPGALLRGRTITEGVFHAPALVDILRAWAGETRFRASLASASSMVPYLRLEELRPIPAVVDLVDVDSQKWLDYAAFDRGPRARLYRMEGTRLRQLEQTLPSWARAVTLVSDAEAELFRQFCSWDGVHAVTNGVDLDYFRPMAPAPPEDGCVFVGALDYRPNVDAVTWFGKEVWPRLRRRRPDARLRLVGRRPVPEVTALARVAGIEVVGQVPDVRPYLAGAAVVVAPLRIARGLQNKVLEAMAMGRAVVSSPQALTGLSQQLDAPALVASTRQEWVDQVVRLLDNAALREQLGAEGRRYVEAHHHWERCLEPFAVLLGLNGASRGSHPPLPDLAPSGMVPR
jgi:sugar transferase (PEP-CTERM/EpsH1 system associated)